MRKDGSCVCARGHRFDCARSGYVNLLLSNEKRSKDPGDDRLMVDARRAFLDAGWYAPLADEACRLMRRALSRLQRGSSANGRALRVLDVGCGEGYYTERLRAALKEICGPEETVLLGVDISRTALDKAGKRARAAGVPPDEVRYAAASAFRLPVADRSCDALMNLFAPLCGPENRRVLTPGGLLLLAVPGRRHLFELKEIAYDHPYENEERDDALEGFRLLEKRELSYPMALRSGQDIRNLFRMTPYYYKTGRIGQARVEALEELQVTAAFSLLLYERADGRTPSPREVGFPR